MSKPPYFSDEKWDEVKASVGHDDPPHLSDEQWGRVARLLGTDLSDVRCRKAVDQELYFFEISARDNFEWKTARARDPNQLNKLQALTRDLGRLVAAWGPEDWSQFTVSWRDEFLGKLDELSKAVAHRDRRHRGSRSLVLKSLIELWEEKTGRTTGGAAFLVAAFEPCGSLTYRSACDFIDTVRNPLRLTRVSKSPLVRRRSVDNKKSAP
jgi:hypothetical protein